MRQVTLRIPLAGHDRLMTLCRTHGVSKQAVFEAATLVALADEADPERHELQVTIWEIARRLEQSGALWGGKERHRLTIKMDDRTFADLQDACRRFGVSHNAALGLVVMRWPDEDYEVSVRYRAANLDRIVARARCLDFERRSRVKPLTTPTVTLKVNST